MSRVKEADRQRLRRRAAWEATQTPEQIKAADEERLAVLKLKFRAKQNAMNCAMAKAAKEHVGQRRPNELNPNVHLRKIAEGARVAAVGHFQRQQGKAKHEARAVHLAHGFIRGVTYSRMERMCYTRPNWSRVLEIINDHRYGDDRVFDQRIEQWLQGAQQADNLYVIVYDEENAIWVSRKFDPAAATLNTLMKLREKRDVLDDRIREMTPQ
jgi:hypothetical protein